MYFLPTKTLKIIVISIFLKDNKIKPRRNQLYVGCLKPTSSGCLAYTPLWDKEDSVRTQITLLISENHEELYSQYSRLSVQHPTANTTNSSEHFYRIKEIYVQRDIATEPTRTLRRVVRSRKERESIAPKSHRSGLNPLFFSSLFRRSQCHRPA